MSSSPRTIGQAPIPSANISAWKGRNGAPVGIVGVARTIKYQTTAEKPMDFVYLPLSQHPVPRVVLLVQSGGDPLQLVNPMKNVVRSLNPNLPLSELRTYDDLYRYSVVDGPRIAIEIAGAMGAVGFLLAFAGLYGLCGLQREPQDPRNRYPYGHRRRTGRRTPPRDGERPPTGGGGDRNRPGNGLRSRATHEFHAVQRRRRVDILAYLTVVPSMFIVTMLAAWVPARRAARIEPTQALRYE